MTSKSKNVFKGLTFVIAGRLSKSQDEWKEEIESHGGRLAASVSKFTDFVITTREAVESDTNKIREARTKHIPFIRERALIEAIKQGEWDDAIVSKYKIVDTSHDEPKMGKLERTKSSSSLRASSSSSSSSYRAKPSTSSSEKTSHTKKFDLRERLLHLLANQHSMTRDRRVEEDRKDYKLYTIVCHYWSIGNDLRFEIGFIESFTPSGQARVRMLPMKDTEHKITHGDEYWKTQVDVEALEEADDVENVLGNLELFRWHEYGGYGQKSVSGGFSTLNRYDAERDSKPHELHSLTR
jgi:hypothetical protein